MLKYPISTLLYLAKINIKDTIQDALKLHDNIDVRITITVKDKDDNIIKVNKQKSHSFVANFLYILASILSNNEYSWTNTANTSNTEYFNSPINEALSLIYNGVYYDGIVIGTGTATPTASDYALGNQIGNGTNSGQMKYNNISFTAPSIGSNNTTTFKISQTFQNQSGASITVTEVGLQVASSNAVSSVTTVLIVHDLLSSPITVPNNAVLTIVYTISVTT